MKREILENVLPEDYHYQSFCQLPPNIVKTSTQPQHNPNLTTTQLELGLTRL